MLSRQYAAGVLPFALAAVGILAPVQGAHAQAPTKQLIQALYDKEDAAIAKRDLNATLAFYTPDFQATAKTGQTFGVVQQKQQLQQLFTIAKTLTAKSVVKSVKPSSSGALVEQKGHVSISLVNPQTQKLQTIEIDAVSDDTWVKSGGKWLRKSSKGISQSMTVDGKPLAMPGAAHK